jgi:hypothetical protein
LPHGWRKLANEYPIAQILREPALRAPLTRGLLDPRWTSKSGVVCFWPDDCLTTYLPAKASGSLGHAVATGRIEIAVPAYRSCCAISLDDPDLRPIDDVVAEYLAKRKVRNASQIGTTPQSVNEMLELNTRLALKHLFVLNFVYNASPSLVPAKRRK